MKNKNTRKVINIVLALIFLFSAFNIGMTYYNYTRADDTYSDLREEYAEIIIPPSEPGKDKNEITAEAETEKKAELPVKINFKSLLKKNEDVIGWLYCPDTPIDYPVAQGKDNNEYLRHDLEGNYIISGTLFADYRNGAPGEDSNYIIYGHNMKNGTMFGTLSRYKSYEYYEEHPVIYYLTPDRNYIIEPFACMTLDRYDEIYTPDMPKEALLALLTEYREKADLSTDIILSADDSIVTFSTCSYEFDDARCILLGRITEM